MARIDVSVKLHNIELENPTVLASGIMGVTPSSLKFCEQNGAGALTTKSIGLEPRKGHPNPTVIEFPAGIINAVGLSNPGARAGAGEIVEARARCSVPVFASIFGRTVDEYGEVARIIGEAGPHMVEVNVSCPNVESEFGRMFCMDLVALQKVTQIVKDNVHCPVFVKLSPNVPDIKNAAIAAVAGGADGITAINTVGPGMLIDPVSRKPVLANIVGGLSGPAIKPIAVRCVYDIRKVVDVPIIGVGGISSGNDIVEMLLAGANAVGIGSAVWYRGVDVFRTSVGELKDFMQKNGYSDVNQLVGGAHE